MQNIIAGIIVGAIFITALYFSLRGEGSSCSSCNGSCHSNSCSTDKKKYDKNSDLNGIL